MKRPPRDEDDASSHQCTRHGVETEAIEKVVLRVESTVRRVVMGQPSGFRHLASNFAPREEVERYV